MRNTGTEDTPAQDSNLRRPERLPQEDISWFTEQLPTRKERKGRGPGAAQRGQLASEASGPAPNLHFTSSCEKSCNKRTNPETLPAQKACTESIHLASFYDAIIYLLIHSICMAACRGSSSGPLTTRKATIQSPSSTKTRHKSCKQAPTALGSKFTTCLSWQLIQGGKSQAFRAFQTWGGPAGGAGIH